MKISILFTFLFLYIFNLSSQIVINEITSRGNILDDDGGQSDWIELYNAGATTINIQNYGLSDDALNPLKWKLPDVSLNAGQYFLVLANGGNIISDINHWESAVLNTHTWSYFVATSEPDEDWNEIIFDDSGWESGMGGIGYGDDDDNTIIPSTTAVYMRHGLAVDDTSLIQAAKLHADYDDGFVAYLNGVEIARSGNMLSSTPAYDELANTEHEAGMYAGYDPELFDIPSELIKSLLVPETNYLCVQVHNASIFSSDLSSNIWLSFGIETSGEYYNPVPAWFGAEQAYNQTNFKIDNLGETIYLSDTFGNILDSKFSGELSYGHSLARVPDGSASWCVTNNLSPSASNNSATCFDSYEPAPLFSLVPGSYDEPQTLELSSPSLTSVIRYTIDGSVVTDTSFIYTSPIAMDTNITVAAKCFTTGGKLPGKMVMNTYFIEEDEFSVPVISISIDPTSLFDYDSGIYVYGCCYDVNYPYYGANFWQPWERFAHIEYFNEAGVQQWSKDMAIEIHGGWSRAEDQRSFRIDFKNEYDGELNYHLWSNKPEPAQSIILIYAMVVSMFGLTKYKMHY